MDGSLQEHEGMTLRREGTILDRATCFGSAMAGAYWILLQFRVLRFSSFGTERLNWERVQGSCA